MGRGSGTAPRASPHTGYVLSVIVVAVILFCGLYFVVGLTDYGENVERRALLATTSAAAASFDSRAVATLEGSARDLTSSTFTDIREDLKRIHAAVDNSRFVYLMGVKDDKVIFLADAEDMDSPDYSPPGEVYDETTPLLRRVFAEDIAATEGPVTDHYGTWVSGLTPLRDPQDGHVVAVFGIDISAADWQANVARFRWLGIAICGFLAVTTGLFASLLFREHRLRGKLATASRIVENSSTILYRLGRAASLPLTFISSNVARLGYSPSEFNASQTFLQDLVHPADRPEIEKLQNQILGGHDEPEPVQFRLRAKDGAYYWVDNRMTVTRDHSGRLVVAEGMFVDISERKEMEEKLQFANLLLTTEMETSPDGILVVDNEARIISFNRRFADMWNIPLEVLRAGNDRPVLEAVTTFMKDPAGFMDRVEYLYAHPKESAHDEAETNDGRFIERHTAALRTADGQHLGRVWFFRDITGRRTAEAEIRHTARHDGLTGLANRRMFVDAVRKAMTRERQGIRFAVLYLDLDHFKDVNDTLGHPVGDLLLCAVAERLRLNVRDTDLVARFGGDEFAVLVNHIDHAMAVAQVAEKLVSGLGAPFAIQANLVPNSVSIGIAMHDPDDSSVETLLSHADVALYRAKADGRNCYRFFTDAMDQDVRARVKVTSELREAIASDQFILQYQPQVEIATGRIIGVEALVRWRHPERGLVSPAEFIPVAESSGLVTGLGSWVLFEACRQGSAWLGAGGPPVSIAVNVSPTQFRMAVELERDVTASLASSGLPPQHLELELTETALMEASLEHRDILLRLRQGGIRFAIDDFGTGYSSLDYLRRYPADRVKIAQEFVRLIAVDQECAAIVRTVIGLARELGMVAIAEGVETREQLELLTLWGCREAQGYYFSAPLGADEVLPLLRAGMMNRTAVERPIPSALVAADSGK